MFAPAGTPIDITERLSSALKQALASPEIIARLAALSAQPFNGARLESSKFIQSEIDKYGQIVRDRKITAE